MVYAIDTREGGPVSDTNICYLKANALHNVAYQELLSLRGRDFYGEIKAIVSCLPYDKTLAVAKIAHEYNISYFDLTEDVKVRTAIKSMLDKVPRDSAFVPSCGLAPGYINQLAAYWIDNISEESGCVTKVKLRVGALPYPAPANSFKYTMTWSIDGLVNEYIKTCEVLREGQKFILPALGDREELEIDGVTYEAFNTSGGIGTLVDTYQGKIQELDYKTIRYVGHLNAVKKLMSENITGDDSSGLKRIFNMYCSPPLNQLVKDIVLIKIEIYNTGEFATDPFVYTEAIGPKEINGVMYSAIQVATAGDLVKVVDHVLTHKDLYKGFVTQERLKGIAHDWKIDHKGSILASLGGEEPVDWETVVADGLEDEEEGEPVITPATREVAKQNLKEQEEQSDEAFLIRADMDRKIDKL